MKQLFVTHISKTKKKEERHEIFKCCERKEEKIDNNENCPLMNIQENPSNQTLSSSSSSTTNSSIDPQKISFNIFITEPQITVNTNYSVNSNSSNLKNLLGKKTKVHFDIIKNEDIKGISSSSNNYNFNNLNLNLNISNSQSLDGSIINKEIDKNDESLEFIEEKGDINDNLSINRKEEKKEYLNTGRWSYKEHIKFIEAIAEYGKNWKDVQKYVGSRSSAQARSHAQKFFLKLKAIKNPKFDFDFSSNNIKSLLDIIEIIKKNKEYYMRGKEYIINTLITLSESISSENNNDDLCKTIYIKNSKKELNENNELILNNNKELKFDIINIHNDNSKKVKFKNKKCLSNKDKDKDKENKKIKSKTNDSIIGDDMNNDMNNSSIVNNNINDSNSLNYSTTNVSMNKEHKNLEKINDIDINQIEEDIVDNIKEENEININDFFGEIKKKKIIFDDGIMYFSDDSEFFDMNNISLKMKEYCFLQNFESPNFLYNKYFFS
jgi:SHAQKYF class myb-like DNA-binding protein